MEEIQYKGKTADNLVIVEITKEPGGTPEKKYFHGIRCGLAFPPPGSTSTDQNTYGYFCLIGQEVNRLLTGQYPMTLLAEGQDAVILELFRKMFDAMVVFGATEIFTDLSQSYRFYAEHLMNYYRMKRSSQDIIIEQAPYADVFRQGFETADRMASSKLLYIPKSSIARSQFKVIKKEDLDMRPEMMFNGINAVRYVLAAMEMVEVSITGPPAKLKTVSPLAWT